MLLRATVALILVVTITGFDLGVGKLLEKRRVGGPNMVCFQHPLDIVFILDASASIWAQNFTKAKQFVNSFIAPYEISPSKVRVSLETYADKVYENDIIHFVDFADGPSLRNHIKNIKWHHGSRTETGMGISYMRTNIMPQARPGVPKICIVITDGNSQEPEKTALEAKKARDDGIEMFAIGVSEDVTREELENIAGDPDRVIIVKTYQELEAIKDKLSGKTCRSIPTPPPTPAAEECGIDHPTDIYYVFDPAYLGFEGVSIVTQFITHTLSFREFTHFRIGVISGSCPLDAGFNLDRYSSLHEIRGRLNEYEISRLPTLIERLPRAYRRAQGGRNGANRVAVIFVGGKIDAVSVLKSAQEAKNARVSIYFVVVGRVRNDLLRALDEIGINLSKENSGSLSQANAFLNYLCRDY